MPEIQENYYLINSLDNYDIPTYMMVGSGDSDRNSLAMELKGKLNLYKTAVSEIVTTTGVKFSLIELDIETEVPAKVPDYNRTNESWEMFNFYNVPLAGTLAILSSIQNEVLNAENIALSKLIEK